MPIENNDKGTEIAVNRILSIEADKINKTFLEEMFAAYHDKETNQLLKTFTNRKEAQNYLQASTSDHIREVCLGKRKTAYGYKWKYL